jgi:phosphoglycolate phosphatase-like HAD superfamily hydrolase
VPVWRIHRHIGMGGDQIVSALCGEDAEREHGDALREREGELFSEVIDQIRPIPGAKDLVAALKDDGHEIVLASSAKEEELEHYLDLLDVRDLADATTSSADVDQTKPAPDIVEVAMRKVSGEGAVMLGDSTWDAIAAKRAGIPTIGLLTGGFSEGELHDAGADPVFSSLEELREARDSTPLR